jgi:hypothetical protein
MHFFFVFTLVHLRIRSSRARLCRTIISFIARAQHFVHAMDSMVFFYHIRNKVFNRSPTMELPEISTLDSHTRPSDV